MLTLQAALVEDGPRMPVLFLMGVVVFVLLIACANVAGMFLARHAGRVMEFSVRHALGAGRVRLIQQLLVESLLFAIFGGAFCLLLSYWGVHLLRAKLSFNAETAWLAGLVGSAFIGQVLSKFLYGVRPRDPITLACAAALVLVISFVAVCLPARRATKIDPMVALRYE